MAVVHAGDGILHHRILLVTRVSYSNCCITLLVFLSYRVTSVNALKIYASEIHAHTELTGERSGPATATANTKHLGIVQHAITITVHKTAFFNFQLATLYVIR